MVEASERTKKPVNDASLPVLIAGAGPVGLSLAAALTGQGYRVEVFERGRELANEARASTLHPSSLEMFADWGVADEIVAHGRRVDALQFFERDTRQKIAEFHYSAIQGDTPYPFRLQCPQNIVTRLLWPKIESSGLARLHFGHEALGQRDLGDSVELELSTPSGPRTVRGSYLVGCDGAASSVRQSLGMELVGATFEDRFLLVGTDIDYRPIFPEIDSVAYVYSPEEWVIVMVLPDLVRTVFRLPPHEDGDAALEEEAIRDRMARFIGRRVDYRILMKSHYRVHQRVAQEFRRGRVLLAGDAAHVNNPAGGMGMNSGIHDAHRLGKELGRVLAGASDRLLDDYAAERKRVAVEHVQQQSAANYAELSLGAPGARAARNRQMAEAAHDPAKARAYLLRAAMLEQRI